MRDHLHPRLTIMGVVMTVFDGRTNLAQQVVEEVRCYFPQRIFNTFIPRGVRISEAPRYSRTIAEYDPSSRGVQAYAAFADEVLRRIDRQAVAR